MSNSKKDADKILQNCANFFYSMKPNENDSQQKISTQLKTNEKNKTLSVATDPLKSNQGRPIQRIGRYQIIRKLGEGNYGQVFLVKDLEWKRELALKVLTGGAMANEISVKRFYREAQAISQLKHPNIVGVYEVGRDKSNHFYTMDYICGQSLADVLHKEKRLSAHRATRLMIKVTKAVHYAHQQNIIHRDIKPDNIMINNSSEPFLADFGLAKATQGGTRLSKTGDISGTPAYMAPEQISGKSRHIAEAADIYSLGATLYEMITGQLPFPGKNTMGVLYRVANEAPLPPREINKSIPQNLESVCLKCLEKDPKKRYSTALEMCEDLGRYLNGQSIRATRSKTPKKWLLPYRIIEKILFAIVILGFIVFIQHQSAELTDKRTRVKNIEQERDNTLGQIKNIEQERDNALGQIKNIEQERDNALGQIKNIERERDNALDQIKNIEQKIKKSMAQQIKNQSEHMENFIPMVKGLTGITPRDMFLLPYFVEVGNLPKRLKTIDHFNYALGFAAMGAISKEDKSFTSLIRGKAYFLFYKKEKKQEYLEKAINEFDNAIKINNKEYEAAVFGYKCAEIIEKSKKASSFIECLPPKGKSVYFYFREAIKYKKLALTEKNKKHYQTSIKYLDKALKKNPDMKIALLEKKSILQLTRN
ncbi:protein kinase [Candidatus Uabimicrobium sp. HlEnr_7]|uniref:serine/threonine protein kinase n=1 Tax=Candidatus Uabimicrobium helgolandensis TaxID=3095367 RepID=UPI0035564B51